MKIAFLYAGQGSQTVGMGKDFYGQYELYKQIIDDVDNCLDFNLKELLFDGPIEKLSQTKYTQPCMVAHACAVTSLVLQKGITPKAVAGLSLGEYSALCTAGVFDMKQAVSMVSFRGNEMEKACIGLNCGMAAILGLDESILNEICDSLSNKKDTVSIANYNCPGQLVIAGESELVKSTCKLALEKGAKKCIPLQVSGPFHTKYMEPASKALNEYFKTTNFGEMKIPVYSNFTGELISKEDKISDLLENQVKSSVKMENIIRKMEEDGIDLIIEIGNGKALSGFVRRTCPKIKTYALQNIKDLENLKGILEE